MSDWLSPTLEVLLTSLKIAGVIGAFIGLSGESTRGPKGRRRRIWACAFLAMAIGAELCDSVLKRIDSREQAVRFERLAHPLGTIRVTPLYVFDLSGEDLGGYKKRLVQQGGYVPPDPKTEPAAYALLNAILEMRVFIYQKRDGKAKEDREPDLSFEINLQENLIPRSRTASDEKSRQAQIAEERHYSYSDGELHAQTAAISNIPDDRYSNGSIISSNDLFGSELEIRFCPLVMLRGPNDNQEKETELAQKVRLEQVYITFPGHQEFSILPSDTKNVRSIAAGGQERCSLWSYRFPGSVEEFKKAQVP
jgi:hypothetical protein